MTLDDPPRPLPGDLKAAALALGLAALVLALWAFLEFASALKGRPMLKWLQGKKTYIVGAGLVLSAVGGFMHGDTTVIEAVALVLNGLGLAALRNAVGNT